MDSVAIRLIGKNSKTAAAYPHVLAGIEPGSTGSSLVLQGWTAWQSMNPNTQVNQDVRPVSGKVLELLVVDALWLAGISPMYYQASLPYIPATKYDIFVYHPISPHVVACKTKLRERWKQADLEALALRNVYRGAINVLITTDPEGHDRQRSIRERTVAGLDQVIVIEDGSSEFDEFIDRLSTFTPSVAEPVLPVVGRVLTPEGTVVRPRPMGSERRQTRGKRRG